MEYSIKKDITFIKEFLSLNDSSFSESIGIPRSTLNNWNENKTAISNTQLEKLYAFAYEKGIRLNATKEQMYIDRQKADTKILFHGAKKDIEGIISVKHSKQENDFGQGFYLGESLYQSASFVSTYPQSSIYVFEYHKNKNHKIIEYDISKEWMLTIAYNRGLLNKYKDSEIVKKLIDKTKYADVIIAPIADNNMYQLIDNFVYGNSTDIQCINCLSATDLGKQYVFLNDIVLKDLKMVDHFYLCGEEKNDYIKEKNESNKIGVQKVRYASREYAGKGKYIDQLL